MVAVPPKTTEGTVPIKYAAVPGGVTPMIGRAAPTYSINFDGRNTLSVFFGTGASITINPDADVIIDRLSA